MDPFPNVYDDPARAASYANLEYPATYWLAFRDLPALIAGHVAGRRALDFGCGAGRSTRFLQALGFEVVGVDVSPAMVALARERDPAGRYEVIGVAAGEAGDGGAGGDDGGAAALAGVAAPGSLDLVFCAYPFDNIEGRARRRGIMTALGGLLGREGRLILLASAPELYVNEWTTFTTAAFPENRRAGSGDAVRIVIREGGDPRPVLDQLWTDEDYRSLFAAAGLEVLETARPLGRENEPFAWVSETSVSPWLIYVAGPASPGLGPAR